MRSLVRKSLVLLISITVVPASVSGPLMVSVPMLLPGARVAAAKMLTAPLMVPLPRSEPPQTFTLLPPVSVPFTMNAPLLTTVLSLTDALPVSVTSPVPPGKVRVVFVNVASFHVVAMRVPPLINSFVKLEIMFVTVIPTVVLMRRMFVETAEGAMSPAMVESSSRNRLKVLLGAARPLEREPLAQFTVLPANSAAFV